MTTLVEQVKFGTVETQSGEMFFVTDSIIKGDNSKNYGLTDFPCMLFSDKEKATQYLNVCERIASCYTPSPSLLVEAAKWQDIASLKDRFTGASCPIYFTTEHTLTYLVEVLGMDTKNGYDNDDLGHFCKNLYLDGVSVSFKWYADLFQTDSAQDRQYHREILRFLKKYKMYY